MKRKILLTGIILILLTTIITIYIFVIKPPQRLDFKSDYLIKIEIRTEEEVIVVEENDYQKFLEDINKLKYKDKNTGVKTKGIYLIIITYQEEVYEIGRYYSIFNGENKYTLFNDKFDIFAENWISNNN